jgi:4,5-DOPA dioxygenase extradiol
MPKPLFVSHGAPTLVIENAEAGAFLKSLGQGERPRAVIAVSAHWETRVPTVNAVQRNETIHDFHGFPPELYTLQYNAPGDHELARRIVEMLDRAGFSAAIDPQRGLDHGAWVPLLLAWPAADIPVVQLSVQTHLGPEHHLRLGQALAPLTEEGVLIMGSGSFTHDLSSWRTAGPDEPAWVRQFSEWMDTAILEGRTDELLRYRSLAPYAQRNHPTEEHLLPLFVAMGAAGEGSRAERLHSSLTHGVLRMDAYRFIPSPLE